MASWSPVFLGIALGGSALHAQSIAQPGAQPSTQSQPVTLTVLAAQDHVATQPAAQGLDTMVNAEFDHVTVEDALRQIATAAQLDLSYSARSLEHTKPVTIHLGSVTARVAIHAVLDGTGLVLVVHPNGQLFVVTSTDAQRAETGTIMGRVTDAETKRALVRASVSVEGTKYSTVTDANGGYLLSDIPSGKYRLRARLLGHGSSDRSVTVHGNDTVIVSFSLSSIPSHLQEVVTTGAGDRKRVEVGNAVATLNADSIVSAMPIRNVSDLLSGRVAGVDVQTLSGTVGSGSRIRIRGDGSLNTSRDPILIVDGVRADAQFTHAPLALSVAGQLAGINGERGVLTASGNTTNTSASTPAPSRLDDIDPESIESIDVLRGPAAATLYGSDAADGVIVIKTKRGQAGVTRWNFSGEQGISNMDATYPSAWYGWGHTPAGIPFASTTSTASGTCTLLGVLAHACVTDSVTHFNPLNESATSPFETGHDGRIHGEVSGGASTLQYYLGASAEQQTGVLTLPEALVGVTSRLINGNPIPSWATHPNTMTSLDVTSNMNGQIGRSASFGVNARLVHSYQLNAGEGGGYVAGGVGTFINSAANSLGYRDSTTEGYGTLAPALSFLGRSSDEIDRGLVSANGQWRPFTHLSGNASAGVDYTQRDDQSLLMAEDAPVVSGLTTGGGTRARNLSKTQDRTLNLGLVYDAPLGTHVDARSTLGAQYLGTNVSVVTYNATGLPVGTSTVNSSTGTQVTTREFMTPGATAGWSFDQTLSLNQRLFFTAAVRTDVTSAAGKQSSNPVYPKFNASWLVSQEPIFPHIPGLTSLRLRAAYGQAGQVPDYTSRYLTYTSAVPAYYNGANSPAFTVASLGNGALEPERYSETEGGLDLSLLDDRFTLELTGYNKVTRNALVPITMSPDVGYSYQMTNIGKMRNKGIELTATIHPIETPLFDWSSTFNYAHNSNVVVKLGRAPQTNGQYYRYVQGYAVDGIWARAITSYADVNGDGILEPSEMQLTDSAVYAGRSSPGVTTGWHNSIALFSGRVHIGGSLSYEGSMTQVNGLLMTQCQDSRCQGAVDPSASLAAQAMALAASNSFPLRTAWPFIENTSVLRFDEFSVGVTAPNAMARMLRARTATIALEGRNLAFWTHYRGADPMVNTPGGSGGADDPFVDFGGVPQTRSWALRINLGF
jgi:TonB-linked SusC/RagA family outer membrane protein